MTVKVERFAQNLTPEQEVKVTQLEEAVASVVQTSAAHKAFCSKGTYVRYLKARAWNVHKATKMLSETLRWRAQFKPELLVWEDLAEEAARGKVYILDQFDLEGRPIVFMRPRKEVYGGDNEMRIRWVVYVMEMASKIADECSPDGKMTWLIDFVGYNRKNQPPWKVSLHTLNIVQSHYPERLGRAVNFKPPFLFELFWKAIRPFVDPVTREKLVFLNEAAAHKGMAAQFNLEHLDSSICGSLPEDGMWNYDAYRVKMKEMDEARKQSLETAALTINN